MGIEKIYFFTATIKDWKPLLKEESFKKVIISSLSYLSDKDLIDIFGFVIMPNHIHLIFEMKKMNGKEFPHASFMKYTAHQFKKMLQAKPCNFDLHSFKVNWTSRNYQFWQRDSLPIELYTRKVIEQKLDYIHNNPLQAHWKLCKDIIDYKYSSASFYETDHTSFPFLKHYMDRI